MCWTGWNGDFFMQTEWRPHLFMSTQHLMSLEEEEVLELSLSELVFLMKLPLLQLPYGCLPRCQGQNIHINNNREGITSWGLTSNSNTVGVCIWVVNKILFKQIVCNCPAAVPNFHEMIYCRDVSFFYIKWPGHEEHNSFKFLVQETDGMTEGTHLEAFVAFVAETVSLIRRLSRGAGPPTASLTSPCLLFAAPWNDAPGMKPSTLMLIFVYNIFQTWIKNYDKSFQLSMKS